MNRRKFLKYFIQKDFQLKMICRFWFFLMTSALLSGFVLVFIANNISARDFLISQLSGGLGAGKVFYHFLTVAMVSILLIISVSLVFIVYYAYRVAGPLFNIEKNLKEIGRTGDLTRKIKLRSGDEANFKEFVETLNETLEDIEARVYSVKVRVDQISSEIDRLKEIDNLQELKSALEEIHSLKEDLARSIQSFKIKK